MKSWQRAQGTFVSPWQVNRSTSGWQSSSPKQKGAQKAERAIMVGILMVIHQRNETVNGMDGGHESSERSIRTNRTSKLPGRARCWQSCRHRTRAVTHGPMCRSPPDSAHAGDFVVSARLRPFISGGRCGLCVCVWADWGTVDYELQVTALGFHHYLCGSLTQIPLLGEEEPTG